VQVAGLIAAAVAALPGLEVSKALSQAVKNCVGQGSSSVGLD